MVCKIRQTAPIISMLNCCIYAEILCFYEYGVAKRTNAVQNTSHRFALFIFLVFFYLNMSLG